jgi:methionyl-tRNA formyltransferase
LRIAFFGLPLAALLLHADGHDLPWVALCRREAPGVRRARRTLGRRVRLVPDMSEPKMLAALRATKPDLIVSWFWTKRLPPRVLALAPAIGVHPSLLPRHRGPDPYFWAIDRGDRVTGVTAHLLEREYDTGAILGRRELAIDPTWSAWTLAKRLDRPSLALLRDVVGAWSRGAPPRPRPQPKRGVTAAPAPSDDDLELRWSWPADRIVRRIRAAAPWPGAFTDLCGTTVVITTAEVTKSFPRALANGEAFVRSDGAVVVRAGADAVRLRTGRREDDEHELDEAALAALVGAKGR